MDMLWEARATYQGDTIEYIVLTNTDDIKDALAEARKEAYRVFEFQVPETGSATMDQVLANERGSRPAVTVRKHPAFI